MDTNETNIPLPPSTATQTFLNMQQSLDKLPISKSSTLAVGTQYRIPFEFVVTAEIPHNVCRHPHRHEQVHWEHYQLPPSIGSRSKCQIAKHLEAESFSILYSVCFRVLKNSRKTGIARTTAEWTQPVHIGSSRKERPPLFLPESSKYYCLEKSKAVIGGWCRRLGTLSINTAEPASILSHSPATTATMNLQYDTGTGSPLPDIQYIHSKLNVFTLCTLESWTDFPDLMDPSAYPWHHHCGTRMVPLQPHPLESVKWKLSPPDNYKPTNGLTRYTASISVPIILPGHPEYLPTFFSCLVARTYSVQMSLWYSVEGQWAKASKISHCPCTNMLIYRILSRDRDRRRC